MADANLVALTKVATIEADSKDATINPETSKNAATIKIAEAAEEESGESKELL
jgi:hypothetical protein